MSTVRRARLPAAPVAGAWTLVIVGALAAVIAAWLAGWRLQSIDSASMSPTLPVGSLAIVVPGSGEDAQTGDVIAFRDPVDPHRRLLHRIIGATTSDTEQRYFETQGDGNPAPDPLFVPASNVEGRLVWHVPHLGRAAWALRPPLGLVVLAGLPLLLLTVSEVLRHLGSRRPVMKELP